MESAGRRKRPGSCYISAVPVGEVGGTRVVAKEMERSRRNWDAFARGVKKGLGGLGVGELEKKWNQKHC